MNPKRLIAALGVGVGVSLSNPCAAQCIPEWADGFRTGGLNSTVHALVHFDDGSGTALYAGGLFTSAGGASAFMASPIRIAGYVRMLGMRRVATSIHAAAMQTRKHSDSR